MVNNTFILEHIDQQYCPPTHQPSKRSRLPSSPCLLAGFEPTSVLDRTASDVAVRTLANARSSYLNPHTPHDELEDALNSVLPEPEEPNSSSSPPSSPSSALRRLSNGWSSLSRAKGKTVGPWIAPQPFEILTAIDKKDVMFLMEVRDRNFELLLKKTLNGDTPILYTLKLGKSHQEVAIILVGAFSRFVNHLDDADFSKPKTKELLRLMRTNLKQAIDHGLQTSQSDLISSFLQTLVMSEGERWVNEQVSNTATALRGGSGMQPVDMARESVRSFATRQLKRLPKGQAIASLED